MANTLKPLYGTKTAITITLDSLAANTSRQSTAIDNTTNLYEDALVSGTIVTGAGGGGTVYVYAYGSDGGGTPLYTDGATGTDGAYTPVSPTNLHLLATINVPSASTTYANIGPFPVASAFGGILPPQWGIVVTSPASALGTGNSLSYQPYNGQVV